MFIFADFYQPIICTPVFPHLYCKLFLGRDPAGQFISIYIASHSVIYGNNYREERRKKGRKEIRRQEGRSGRREKARTDLPAVLIKGPLK